jgi:N,N'-diacetyllegionaminate synthase
MSSIFIIAEAGVNHNGDEQLALELVDLAARCGADAVKFQTFSADRLVARGTAKADYQIRAGVEGDQHSMLRSLELSAEAHRRIAQHCALRGIEFMSTPFDEDAATMLLDLGMKRIKVPSGEITNLPFLRWLAGRGVPLIVSTGMATLDEVHQAVDTIDRAWTAATKPGGPEPLTLLHCTSNYPASLEDVNLRAMRTMADATGLPVGYSDHTLGITVATAAAALGATVIEKHFTVDTTLPGPDHAASLTPSELAEFVRAVRDVQRCLGAALKQPTPSEMPIRELVRRSVALARDVAEGTVLRREDLVMLRPGTGIAPAQLDELAGRRMRVARPGGHLLDWLDLE